MDKPYFKVKKLREEAKIPSKREEDAGYDLYGCFDEHFKLLMPGEVILIPTGLSAEIPKDWVLFLSERGSTGSKGIAKRAGIVDSGYRGEIFVATNNTSNKPIVFVNHEGPELGVFLTENNLDDVTIYPQSKAIAQALLFYCPHVEVEEVDKMSESVRGEGALGSSNK